MPTGDAISIAIIIKELVTNAVKHAGPPCRVGMRVDPHDRLTLTVSDTGTGPPEGKPLTGMGTRLVQALVRQLRAEIATTQRAEGYTVEITVPLPQDK